MIWGQKLRSIINMFFVSAAKRAARALILLGGLSLLSVDVQAQNYADYDHLKKQFDNIAASCKVAGGTVSYEIIGRVPRCHGAGEHTDSFNAAITAHLDEFNIANTDIALSCKGVTKTKEIYGLVLMECQQSKAVQSTAIEDSPSCEAELQRLNVEFPMCEDPNAQARNACDTQAGERMAQQGPLAQITQQIGQMSAMSMQMACSKMKKLSQAANSTLAAYKTNCGARMNSCNNQCGEYLNEFTKLTAQCQAHPEIQRLQAQANTLKKECLGFDYNMKQAAQGIQNSIAMEAQAKGCEDSLASNSKLCETYPHLCASQLNCKDPTNAGKKECVCAINARDPMCSSLDLGSMAKPNQPSGSSRGSNLASSGKDPLADMDMPTIGDDNALGFGGSNNSEGSSPAGGGWRSGSGYGGGLGAGGGGGGNPGGRQAGNRGGSQFKSNITSESPGGRRPGWSPSGGLGGGDPNGAVNMASTNPDGVDLRKFLPGGMHDPRKRVAGHVGPDGITCGNCGTLFEKVSTRYRSVGHTLIDK